MFEKVDVHEREMIFEWTYPRGRCVNDMALRSGMPRDCSIRFDESLREIPAVHERRFPAEISGMLTAMSHANSDIDIYHWKTQYCCRA
jgi:hypothetical protein